MTSRSKSEIARNVAIHDRIAQRYDVRHGEIFNPVEQNRLHQALAYAILHASSGSDAPLRAIDVGCGSGNLTRHLLDLGVEVIAADVSRGFLDLVENKFSGRPVTTVQLNGSDLSNIGTASCDIVATYSVLHHVPDYLSAVAEMARVCKPGGVIFLDHEPTDEYWHGNALYEEFRSKALRTDWNKYLHAGNYVARLRRVFDPRYSNEGDIHVWPDDHIEWSKIDGLLRKAGFACVVSNDYLLARKLYRQEVYEQYIGKCTDMRCRIYQHLPANKGGDGN